MNEVWKATKIEHYTRILVRPNHNGSQQTACKRKVTHWCARINGKIVEGFATKKSAMLAIMEGV